MGEHFLEGYGVPKNISRAIELWARAARAGSADAKLKLGHLVTTATTSTSTATKSTSTATKSATTGGNSQKSALQSPHRGCRVAR